MPTLKYKCVICGYVWTVDDKEKPERCPKCQSFKIQPVDAPRDGGCCCCGG